MVPRQRLPLAGRLWGIAAAGLLAATLVACTSTQPETGDTPTAVAPSTEPTDQGSPEPPSAPAIVPDGTAEENLPVFTAVTQQVWASEDQVSGRAYIDALVAAGFDKAAMQVTEDLSTVKNPAESLLFSVRWGDEECLMGQVGPSTGEPVTAVMEQVSGGVCLIGNTRAIDW